MPAANLSAKKKRQWNHVYDSAKAQGDDEATAHKKANSVVGRSKKDFDDDTLGLLESKGYIDYAWEVEGKRLSQEESGYQAMGGTSEKGCHNCHWFIPQDDACVIVAGDIYHTGLSQYWMAIEEYVPEPLPVTIVKEGSPSAKVDRGQGLLDKIKSRFGLSASPIPIVQAESEFIFYKDATERIRWFSRYSNCFKDREREFISTLSHKEFADWCNASGFRPELWLWHTKGSRIGTSDFIGFTDGFAIASGLVDDTPLAQGVVKAVSDGKMDIAASHGFLPIAQIGNVVLQHRTFEITMLPRTKAANVITDYNWLRIKEMGLKPEQREFFKSVGVSESIIDEWSNQTEVMSKALIEAGVEYKALDDDTQTNAVGLLMATQGQTQKAITELATAVKSLNETVTAVKQSDDAKIAQQFTPANDPTQQAHVPSQSTDNVVAKETLSEDGLDDNMKFILKDVLGIDPSKLTGVGA